MIDCIYLYRSHSGWRWRIRDSRNGRIIAASTEAYRDRKAALRNLNRVTRSNFAVPIRSRSPTFSWACENRN